METPRQQKLFIVVAARAKMNLGRAKNKFTPANINSIVIFFNNVEISVTVVNKPIDNLHIVSIYHSKSKVILNKILMR